jgi:hypothetical protein
MNRSMAETGSTLEQDADRAAARGDAAEAARLLQQVVELTSTPAVWVKLSAMRRATGDLGGAMAAADQALTLSPYDFSALLTRAFLLEKAGDPRGGEAFAIAVAHAPAGDATPPALAAALDHARGKAAEHQRTTEEQLLSVVPAGLAPAAQRRLERFVANSARRTRHFHQEPTHFHYPGMPEIEFHDTAPFGLGHLEAGTDVIRSEFEALMAAEAAELVPYIQYPDRVPLRQWKELNNNRQWTAIHLLQNGGRVKANARHCPRTLELLAELQQPDVPNASPNAMFSLLAPRTRIPPHTGVANTRLVCHLPLIVPPGCGFRVGATSVEWTPGTAFVFDDTIEHEAWNDSDQLRVVLIFDLWPPALSEDERAGVARIIPAAGVTFGGGL